MTKKHTVESFQALVRAHAERAVHQGDVRQEWVDRRFAEWGMAPAGSGDIRTYRVKIKTTEVYNLTIEAGSRAEINERLAANAIDYMGEELGAACDEMIVETVEFVAGPEDPEPAEPPAPPMLTLDELRDKVRWALLDANQSLDGQYICRAGLDRTLRELGLDKAPERVDYTFETPIGDTGYVHRVTYSGFSEEQARRRYDLWLQQEAEDRSDGLIDVYTNVPREALGTPVVVGREKR